MRTVTIVAHVLGILALCTSDVSADCLTPLSFGAVVNDGLDDRAAIQSALDAACAQRKCVDLPDGDLHVTRRFGTGADNAWSLALGPTCDGVLVRGHGDSSRLVMMGSAKIGAMTGPGDWWLFKVSGSNNTLRDFMIDGSQRAQPTSEQTHLIKLLGPATGTTLENLRLNLPDAGGIGTGGDCIQAGGEMLVILGITIDMSVRGLVIDKVRADACDRSFIGLQRWVHDVTIDKTRTLSVGDQALDMEPTGVGNITNVRVRNSSFRRNGLGDAIAVSLAGSVGGAPAGGPFIVENSEIDGSVHVYDSAHVTLQHLKIVSSGPQATIEVRKRSDDLLIDHVYAEHFGPTTGHVVFLGAQSGVFPRNATIRASHFVQRTDGDVIHGEPIIGLRVEGSQLECVMTTPNAFQGIFVRSVNAIVDDVKVRGNTLTGNCRSLVRASATPGFLVGTVSVHDNLIRGTSLGVWFENGIPTSKPNVSSNVFEGITTVNQIIGTGTPGWIGSN